MATRLGDEDLPLKLVVPSAKLVLAVRAHTHVVLACRAREAGPGREQRVARRRRLAREGLVGQLDFILDVVQAEVEGGVAEVHLDGLGC